MLVKRLRPAPAVVLSDIQLVNAYAAGDELAFETLLHRHKRKVWSHIYLMVRDREVTEDLFQEAFIKVVHHLIEVEEV